MQATSPVRARSAGLVLGMCVLTSILALTAHGSAQEAGTDLDTAARTLFEDGRHSFEAGDFEAALSRFQQAYEISHRVPLLWNIATTLDRLRRDEEALAGFEQYLAAAPDAANRAEVEGRIRSLREAVERRHAEDAARAAEAERIEAERRALEEARARETNTPPATPAAGGGGITPIVFFVGLGLTAVAGGVLIWSGIDTLAANDNYLLYTNSVGAEVGRAEALFNEANAAQLRTNIMVGVTAGLAAATAVLAIFTDWDGDPPPADSAAPVASTLRPSVAGGPDGFSLGLTGSF